MHTASLHITKKQNIHRETRCKQKLLQGQINGLLLGIILIFLFGFFCLRFGVVNYSFKQILSAFAHPHANSIQTITIIKVRLPMVLMAVIAGAGLAVSGLLLQRVTQNPLACPSLSGIEYGTAFSVIVCYMFIPQVERHTILLIALSGSVLTYLIMQLLIKKMGATLTGIILIGVTFNTLFYSAIQALLLAFPYQAQSVLYDLNGSLQSITLKDIKLIAIPFFICLLCALPFIRRLDFLDLDDFQASALGVPIKKYRFFLLGLSILLSTLITCMIGPLLFFGLIIPHLAKPFARNSFILLYTCFFGSVFLLLVLLLIQIFMPNIPPPLGIVMLLMASPLMIFIIRKYYI